MLTLSAFTLDTSTYDKHRCMSITAVEHIEAGNIDIRVDGLDYRISFAPEEVIYMLMACGLNKEEAETAVEFDRLDAVERLVGKKIQLGFDETNCYTLLHCEGADEAYTPLSGTELYLTGLNGYQSKFGKKPDKSKMN